MGRLPTRDNDDSFSLNLTASEAPEPVPGHASEWICLFLYGSKIPRPYCRQARQSQVGNFDAPYQTSQMISPPTLSFLAFLSESTPLEVDRMVIPNPFRTRGMSPALT